MTCFTITFVSEPHLVLILMIFLLHITLIDLTTTAYTSDLLCLENT
jgi:hypothetical protein